MRLNDFIPGDVETEVLSGLKDYVEKNQQFSYTAQQKDQFGFISDRASKIGRIGKLAPHLEPGVVMALADANANDSLIAKIGLAAIAVEAEKAEKEQQDTQKGVFGNIYSGIKTGFRWGTAALQTVAWDIPFAAGSSVLSPVEQGMSGDKFAFADFKNPLRKGFWASTELGTQMMQGNESGSGFFVEGEAKRDRQKRLQDFAGKIPLTVEAGAAENTAFEATPEQLHTVAMQILANKDITYEEAIDEANRLIRSNAYTSFTVDAVSPLLTGFIGDLLPMSFGGVGNEKRDAGFQFRDIGSEDYAMAQALTNIVLSAAMPDPTGAVWKGFKKGIAYARGINYVDDAGNLLYDTRNIAQNADEARFMADVDAMVVLANDFEVSALSTADEAIELATPQPGVWYHGSKTGPIPGNRLFDIDDPRYPTPEHLLVGPGFYITESPTIGQSYARRSGATRAITPEEEATLRSIPGAISDDFLQMGLADDALGRVPTEPPAAVYRFGEVEGSAPRLLDADYGLAETLPGATVPQATAEEIDRITRFFIDDTDKGQRLRGVFEGDEGLAGLFNQLNVESLIQDAFNALRGKIANEGFLGAKWNYLGTGVTQGEFNQLWIKAVSENPEMVRQIKYVPPSITAKRVADATNDFLKTFGRAPESVDELSGFISSKMPLDEFLYGPREDSFNWFTYSTFDYVLDELLYEVPARKTKSVLGSANLNIMRNRLANSSPSRSRTQIVMPATEDLFPRNTMEEMDAANAIFRQSADIAAGLFATSLVKFNDDVEKLFLRANLSAEEINDIRRFNAAMNMVSNESKMFFLPGRQSQKGDLAVNSFLRNELGVDGWTHIGGNRWGAETPHRVRVYFDPMKHLDITDPLTGERLPINEAINKMRESGQLAERAGEIRLQIDEMKTMVEAGVLPGYGPVVDPVKFNTFFTESRAGRVAVDRVWEVVEKFKPGVVGTENNTQWYQLWKMFKGRLPLDVMDEMLRATSKTELLGVLNQKVGFTPGLTNIDDIGFSLSRTISKLKEASRIDVLLDKADEFFGPVMARSPKSKHLNIFGSPREQLQALKDLDAFLETGVRSQVNKALRFNKFGKKIFREREQIVAEFAQAMMKNDKNAMFVISDRLKSAIEWRVLAETGDAAQAKLAADVWQTNFDNASGRGLFNMSDEGLRTDNGYAAALDDAGEISLYGATHGGPGLLSELLASPLELPDVQELRRMTSFLGMFTGKQGLQRFIKKSELRTKTLQKFGIDLTQKDLTKIGELRVPLRVTDFLMNKVWKNSKKFSLAYGLRNTMEAQARLAFSDKENIFTHPLDHILVSTHARIPDDIALGEAFNPLGWGNLGKVHEEAGEGYRTMLGNAYYGSDQAMDMMESQFRVGEFVVRSKDNPVEWAQAGGYELRQLFNDPIASRIANGASVDDVMKWLYSDADDAKKALKQVEDVMRNGEMFYTSYGIAESIPVNPTPANVRLRVEAQQAKRVTAKTGGDPELMNVVATGTIKGEDAFLPNGQPSKALVEYLVENVEADILPTFYKGRAKVNVSRLKATESWFDQATKMFFDGLVGRAHNVLDRSPLWRREYSKEVARLAPLLSKEAAEELKQIVFDRVKYYDDLAKSKKLPRSFTVQDWVGTGVDSDEFLKSLDEANGWMTRDEMHVLANGLTLDKIENLLFDASARNSVTDAARIISPFGAAFAEVLKTWVKLTAQNPDKVIKLGRKFEILAGTDQSESLQNKGIIHKDPVTGQYFYSLPMSRQVASLFNKIVGEDTGSQYGLQAPVKGLNMAFNFTPGFSPVVGYPLGKLLYNSPKLRDYAAFFLPYGQPKSPTDPQEYLPGWLSKIVSGLVGDPKSAGIYGDTLSDVIRTEAATGKWNLSDPEERSAFERDAEAKAKVLSMLRGIGQLLGPASPVIESKIKTKGGDVYASMLTSEFHKLQSEDYDTAVERFLALYGEEPFVFMAGKTKQVLSGVESSREFAKWELDNADLFDTPFADVAGFFGPKGSDFDWAAYNYQINTGKKERIVPLPTQLEIAEQTLGLYKYRKIVEAGGPNPNEQVSAIIAAEKAKLEKQYPGMVSQSSFDVQRFPKTLKQLRLAVKDPRLKNNETAQALKQYLDLRDIYTTFAKSNNIGWSSPKSLGLRGDLRFKAQALIKQTPEFGRLFDRLLLPELDK